jgi:hypothetical protein
MDTPERRTFSFLAQTTQSSILTIIVAEYFQKYFPKTYNFLGTMAVTIPLEKEKEPLQERL